MRKYDLILLLLILTLSHCHIVTFAQNVGLDILAPLGKLHIKGSADISQFIIDANSTQSNTKPFIKLRSSSGSDLMWIHSDHPLNAFLGVNAGRVNDATAGGVFNTFIGAAAGYSNTIGMHNTANGFEALFSNTTGEFNTTIGSSSLRANTSGNENTANGEEALRWNFTGNSNTANGYRALYNNSRGSNNIAIGNTSLYTQSYDPDVNFNSDNVAVGVAALYNNEPNSTLTGIQNTAVGNNALLTNTTGANNTTIGFNADVTTGNLTNASAIGYNAKVAASNALVLGGTGTDAVNVGIGTMTPSARLDVNGTIKVTDGTEGVGKILTSDAAGLASWQPPPPPPTYYPSVGICCQNWMTKNLDVSTYRNGDPIPKVTDGTAWGALTTGAYCYYDNDSTTYAATYGKLYNWYAVNDPRGLAPEGWHVPSDFEWTTLGNCLGGESVAGGPMKEIGTVHWISPNSGATNLSNFRGLPGGHRFFGGVFNNIGFYGYWWSSTEEELNWCWSRTLSYFDDDLFRGVYHRNNGLPVRCVRD